LALLGHYGAPLTLAEITRAVEACLSQQLFRSDKETAWPEEWSDDERVEHGVHFTSSEYLSCSAPSCEEVVHTRDVEEKLKLVLEPEERVVFEGLKKGKSKRELARICRCAPGTIEKIRSSVQEKAAKHDPVVRTRAKQIQAKENPRY
jgi:DNA-binding NarL/FixJ family response regulator